MQIEIKEEQLAALAGAEQRAASAEAQLAQLEERLQVRCQTGGIGISSFRTVLCPPAWPYCGSCCGSQPLSSLCALPMPYRTLRLPQLAAHSPPFVRSLCRAGRGGCPGGRPAGCSGAHPGGAAGRQVQGPGGQGQGQVAKGWGRAFERGGCGKGRGVWPRNTAWNAALDTCLIVISPRSNVQVGQHPCGDWVGCATEDRESHMPGGSGGSVAAWWQESVSDCEGAEGEIGGARSCLGGRPGGKKSLQRHSCPYKGIPVVGTGMRLAREPFGTEHFFWGLRSLRG